MGSLFTGLKSGGVIYAQMRTPISGLARKGRVVGMNIVEITPRKDVNGITAGRFVCMMIGAAVRVGYFDGPLPGLAMHPGRGTRQIRSALAPRGLGPRPAWRP
ncbi:hypothetical protein [Paracoccus sp. MKU1]|uniref:hypothetical protein n=1 Tax=Paracoccus sp. MKU1 TaxID=1745182 RepID=UPI00071935F5|nr:hypothetical protein [Paracoccus sp. MKU1]KRW96228.1 hypothetical protein AQY21_10110 [Paracoccus sp. MKU1]